MDSGALAQRLLGLARDGGRDGRNALMLELSRLYFDGPAKRSDSESELFGDVACALTSNLPPGQRAGIAEYMADQPLAPRRFVLTLGHDEIAVARPVLERSPVLTAEDLADIVERRGEEHRLSVVARPNIPAALSLALAKHGGEEIHLRLATHPRAALPGLMRDMLPTPEEARRLVDSSPASYSAAAVAQEVVKRVQLRRAPLEAELLQLNEKKLFQVMGHVLAMLAETKPEIAMNALRRGRPEASLVLMRASGAGVEALDAMLAIQAGLRGLKPPPPHLFRTQFEALDMPAAARVIRFLNLRQTVELPLAA